MRVPSPAEEAVRDLVRACGDLLDDRKRMQQRLNARDRYGDAVLLTGFPAGTPQEALDTACTIHLAGLRHQPDSQPQ